MEGSPRTMAPSAACASSTTAGTLAARSMRSSSSRTSNAIHGAEIPNCRSGPSRAKPPPSFIHISGDWQAGRRTPRRPRSLPLGSLKSPTGLHRVQMTEFGKALPGLQIALALLSVILILATPFASFRFYGYGAFNLADTNTELVAGAVVISTLAIAYSGYMMGWKVSGLAGREVCKADPLPWGHPVGMGRVPGPGDMERDSVQRHLRRGRLLLVAGRSFVRGRARSDILHCFGCDCLPEVEVPGCHRADAGVFDPYPRR